MMRWVDWLCGFNPDPLESYEIAFITSLLICYASRIRKPKQHNSKIKNCHSMCNFLLIEWQLKVVENILSIETWISIIGASID